MVNGLSKCENCPSFKKSIFCSLSSEEQSSVADIKITNSYKKGQTLIVQAGSYVDGIRSGNVWIILFSTERTFPVNVKCPDPF